MLGLFRGSHLHRDDYSFAPRQWEMALLCNDDPFSIAMGMIFALRLHSQVYGIENVGRTPLSKFLRDRINVCQGDPTD